MTIGLVLWLIRTYISATKADYLNSWEPHEKRHWEFEFPRTNNRYNLLHLLKLSDSRPQLPELEPTYDSRFVRFFLCLSSFLISDILPIRPFPDILPLYKNAIANCPGKTIVTIQVSFKKTGPHHLIPTPVLSSPPTSSPAISSTKWTTIRWKSWRQERLSRDFGL